MNHLRTSNVFLQFGNITVNNINHSSGIFVGENYQYSWGAHFKANHGFGELLGANNVGCVYTVLISDNDYIDAPIDDRDVVMGNAVEAGVAQVPVVAQPTGPL